MNGLKISMKPNHNSIEPQNEKIVQEILGKLKTLGFGHITITVHNAKIVQIETTEKKRFEKLPLHEDGSGI
jgi:hypothetical protein